MTDKEQIIIDGVDVSGCVQFTQEGDCCNLGGGCKGWPNCYYKQLKRKEQECEKLKNQMNEDYNYYATELKTLRDIISNKEKRNAALHLTSSHYRKALEEIRKIIASQDVNTRPKLYDFEQDCKILDVISKAIGEGNG